MKALPKTLLETFIFFIAFTLVVYIFNHEIDWKLILIGTILNLDFNIVLNWISSKDKSNNKKQFK